MSALSNIPGLDKALAAIAGGNPTGGEGGNFKDLPYDREIHVTVESAEYKPSNSGAPGIKTVLQVTDPEFEGSKVWDSLYFTGHEFQGQRLAVYLSAASASADSIEEAVPKLVGGKLIIALQEPDDPQYAQYPKVRWMAADTGQALKLNVKPKAKKQAPVGLQVPNVVEQIKAQQAAAQQPATLPGVAEAAPVPQEAPPAPAPVETPAPAPAPSGIKLPGQ